jgi:hypothetical protein
MPVNYPKFDKKIQDQITTTEMQKARTRPGVIMSYDKVTNTAIVVLEDQYSDSVGNVIKNVACPYTRGVQFVSPVPGERCLVGFRDNNEAKPYIINIYQDLGSNANYNYNYTLNTGIPKFMVY